MSITKLHAIDRCVKAEFVEAVDYERAYTFFFSKSSTSIKKQKRLGISSYFAKQIVEPLRSRACLRSLRGRQDEVFNEFVHEQGSA